MASGSDVILNSQIDASLPPWERQGPHVDLRACPSPAEVRGLVGLLEKLPREPMPDRLKSSLLRSLRPHQRFAPPFQTPLGDP